MTDILGIPNVDPIRITNIAEIRTPIRPSNSLPAVHASWVGEAAAAAEMVVAAA